MSIKKILTVLIVSPLQNILFTLLNFVRKDKNIILFFHTEAVFYDNSRYLFKYMINENDTNSILLLKNKSLYLKMKQTYPGKAYYYLSFKGLLIFLRSKTIIISYGTSKTEFFPYFLNSKQKNIVYLGHGIPMKRIGKLTKQFNIWFKSKLLQKYTYCTCSSTIEKFILKSAFDISFDNILITGSPRNDVIFKATHRPKPKSKYDYLNKKVILYAPTWRNYGTKFFPFDDFNLKCINDFLNEQDAVILLRCHKEEINNVKPFLSERIILADQSVFPDIVELLPFVNILITDYSGVFFDFLPFNKPIIFIPYDLEKYQKSKGLLFDYKNFTEWCIKNQFDLIDSISLYLEYRIMNNKKMIDNFYLYHDQNNCKRIHEFLTK